MWVERFSEDNCEEHRIGKIKGGKIKKFLSFTLILTTKK